MKYNYKIIRRKRPDFELLQHYAINTLRQASQTLAAVLCDIIIPEHRIMIANIFFQNVKCSVGCE